MPIVFTTPAGQVRLLINDVNEADLVFSDDEITAFLSLEGDNVKLAAEQAIDTIADDQALALKVLRDHEQTTDGAKLADSLRKRAAALRAQVAEAVDLEDDGYFEVIDFGPSSAAELAERPYF